MGRGPALGGEIFTLGVPLGVDPLVTQILYGAKVFILCVDVVLLVTFIWTSAWLLWKEIVGWAKW